MINFIANTLTIKPLNYPGKSRIFLNVLDRVWNLILLCAVIFLLLINHSFGQQTDPVLIKMFPGRGQVPEKGWKWHEGDNPEWANPAFDDAGWKPLNPAADIHDSLFELKKASIGWLSIKLIPDSNIVKKQLRLSIPQSVASEIYLDGVLVKTYGMASSEAGKVKDYNPLFNPFILPVKDNGNNIPQKIADKIFRPFFTTKLTGQGTGLGLSLSYDIIKTQGGDVKVENKEGQGTAFVILLPIVKAHGGELKVEMKEGEENELSFNCQQRDRKCKN